MVCGALWWSPGQTRPLRGQIVQFTFPLWRSGTAVFLASGSRCVTPRPFIGRDPAATHCAHTRLYYLYQKMWAARVSFIHCSACTAVFWLLSRAAEHSVSVSGPAAVWRPCSGRVGSPLWSARTAVRYTHLSARLCSLDRITNTNMSIVESHSSAALGIGSGRVPKRLYTGLSHYLITRQQIDDILTVVLGSSSHGGERGGTAVGSCLPFWTSASTRFEPGRPRGGTPAVRHGGTPAARGSGRCCNRAWRARADRGQLGQCARWQVCLR